MIPLFDDVNAKVIGKRHIKRLCLIGFAYQYLLAKLFTLVIFITYLQSASHLE